MGEDSTIAKGVWAGHSFDVTTVARHRAATEPAEWTDVSDKVVSELAHLWKEKYGKRWRSCARGNYAEYLSHGRLRDERPRSMWGAGRPPWWLYGLPEAHNPNP